jgi:predicted Zn-dependent protease
MASLSYYKQIISFMKKVVIPLIIAFFVFAQSCSKVPITNRKQFKLLPSSTMMSMSATNYDAFLKENQLSNNKANTAIVKRTGAKISAAVEGYLASINRSKLVKDFDWQFNLVKSDVPNAWCMPGGKVVFYEGILPYTKTEAGAAVVMGHEIAHAVAKHGNERMSQQLMIQLGGVALDVALKEKPEQTRSIFLQAYGLGSQVGVTLPYSRKHEYEADKLGMVFMAKAGYNPEEAVKFWERMSKAGGNKPPEFLSTHPSDENRVKELKAFLPKAMKYYKK